MRKKVLWIATLLILSLVLTQSSAFITTGDSASAAASEQLSSGILILKRLPIIRMMMMTPPAGTYIVTTAADNLDNNSPTPGSLRDAIRQANLNPGPDMIEFDIPGFGPHLLNVGAGLPVITDTVTIDGYTQPGATPNTLAVGNDAVLKVEIKGHAQGQGIGLVIAANDCVVQGLAIHGFNHAVVIDGARTDAGASGNVVRGNFIGTNIAGTAVSGDFFNGTGNLNAGVTIESRGFKPDGTPGSANNNLIGGTSPAARNVISGNGSLGVLITQTIGSAAGNLVQGNYIGTNADGNAALGNGAGVNLNSSGNTIGGIAPGAGNVISGNNYNTLTSHGITICCNASNNLLQGNLIGTDATGAVAVPNAVNGVDINTPTAIDNTVGGNSAAARNVISSNVQFGVAIGNTSGNKVQGNYIGTDVTGTQALGNGFNGVGVGGASSALIGGTLPGEGNVISANARGGVEIASNNTVVQGNLIGTQADGVSPLGNSQYGVRVRGSGNLIGGRASGAGNTIAFNKIDFIDAGTAVIVFGSNTSATIVGNSIHSNEGLGIDLGRDWITANDNCDTDLSDGTNNGLQNYPVLTSATSGSGGTTIQGTLNSTPSGTFTLDFYSNPACDAFGFGEGKTYLGSATVTTDATCNASFTTTLPVTVPEGQVLTATTTDSAGNTSEFSSCTAVTPANSPPDAVDDSASTDEETAVIVAVLTNDSDTDGDPLTISSFTQGANGAVSDNGDGTLTYTPNANFSGSDNFTYQIGDGNGGTDSATVTVTVTSVSDPPDAVDDSASTNEDTATNIDVRANDTAGDCGTVTIVSVTQGSNGSVAINGDGTLDYTPNTDFNGTDSFTYTIGCAAAGNDTATVTVSVTPVNDAPVAVNDTYTTSEDSNLNVNAATGVLANDTDAEGSALSAILVSGPANGSLTFNGDGGFSYTPNANFTGTDSFTYKANDGVSDSNTATVTLTVTPVNDPPTATDDSYITDEDTALTVAAPGVLANDSDVDGDVLNAAVISGPAHGVLALNPDGSFTYAPNANFHGADSFTYRVNDGTTNSNTATVTITVNPVNDSPDAVDDAATTAEDSVATINVLSNDTDAEGDTLTVSSVTQGAHGAVVINGDGIVTYTPNADFNGTDTFTYSISDGNGGIDTAIVTVTVTPVSDAPNAQDDAAVTNEDTAVDINVLANDTDPDGDVLLVVSVTQGANGSVSINADGTVRYTPAANFSGADSFGYTVSDGNGGTDTATISVIVSPVNDAPVAADDSYSTNEDTPLTVVVPGVFANDSDPEGDRLVGLLVTRPANGTLGWLLDGSFTYTPAPNFSGVDSFTYYVNDGSLNSNHATVTITVNPVSDPPIANNDSYTTNQNTALNIAAPGVLANDTDSDGPAALTAVLATGPTSGVLTLNPDGSFTYTPDPGSVGCDTFTYKANDGLLDSNTATVNIMINPAGASLTATNSNFSSQTKTEGWAVEATANLSSLITTIPSTAATTDLVFNPTWSTTDNLDSARILHTTTLLRSGEALAVGGTNNASRSFLRSAEIYDHETAQWTRTGDLNIGRGSHTATLLESGKVLVAGGFGNNGQPVNSAELYDPGTGRWTRTRGNLNVSRALHTATILRDGKVLIAGGLGNSDLFLQSAELYDPATETWTRVRNLNQGRWAHTATLLSNGRVLLAGGYGSSRSFIHNSAEIYDPAGNTWTRTAGNLNIARGNHTATPLLDGKVLVACGFGLSGILNSGELYDPLTDRWTRTSNLSTNRWSHTATLLPSGKVLVTGGTSHSSFSLFATNSAELYDPANGSWTRTGNLNTGRHSHTTTLLHNNKVLAVGGMRVLTALNSAELFGPFEARPYVFSTCSPVTATQLHGEGFTGNSRISRIENGKVPCLHVETGEVAECLFSTTGQTAGLMWLEAVDGQYAKTGQAITLQGEPGGEWVVAARVSAGGTVPCVAPTGRDSAGQIASGNELSPLCIVESTGAAYNSAAVIERFYGNSNLFNYSTLQVCTSSNPHPDDWGFGLEWPLLFRIPSCNGSIRCYLEWGAALNDFNGTERSADTAYMPGENRCHMIQTSGYEVPGAKRPATTSFPPPGVVSINTPIVWRPVNPNVEIANHTPNARLGATLASNPAGGAESRILNLNGHGFLPGEQVNVLVIHRTGDGFGAATISEINLTANNLGSISYSAVVPCRGSRTFFATGVSSRRKSNAMPLNGC